VGPETGPSARPFTKNRREITLLFHYVCDVVRSDPFIVVLTHYLLTSSNDSCTTFRDYQINFPGKLGTNEVFLFCLGDRLGFDAEDLQRVGAPRGSFGPSEGRRGSPSSATPGDDEVMRAIRLGANSRGSVRETKKPTDSRSPLPRTGSGVFRARLEPWVPP